MNTSAQLESFIAHCGEMGSRWGFNRTVGQMFGLILISEQPISANEIADTLKISRGNVSMGIKELQSWQLIKLMHVAGDRKDYYTPAGTIWQLANTVFEQRRKREVDPTLSLLRSMLLTEPSNSQEQYAQTKFQEMHDLLENITHWASELQKLQPEQLAKLLKLGSGITKLLGLKDQLFKSE